MSDFNALHELLFGHSDALAEMAGEVSNTDRSLGNEIPLGDEPPDPFQKVVERMQLDPLRKNQRVSDESWDAPLIKTTADRSKERFAKASLAIEHLFAKHPEERDEALAIAKRMFQEERNAIIEQAAA